MLLSCWVPKLKFCQNLGASNWLMQLMCLVIQSCPTPCNPMDCSPPGSSVHGDSPGKNTSWSGLPWPSPEDLPNPVIESRSPALQADSLPFDRYGYYYLKSQEYHTELTHTNICWMDEWMNVPVSLSKPFFPELKPWVQPNMTLKKKIKGTN